MSTLGAAERPELRRWRSGRSVLIALPEWEAVVRRLGTFEPDSLARDATTDSAPTGRAPTALIPLPGVHQRMLLRFLRHGGWMGGVWDWRFLGLARSASELEETARLLGRGAPVPRPVLVWGRRFGLFWSVAVGTVFEENSIDAAHFLAERPSRERLIRAAHAVGRAVRRFHDLGGRHRDLHIGNLLLREGSALTEAWVIDLDRVRVGHAPSTGRRRRELTRLYRSLRKRDLVAQVGVRGLAAFLEAYVDRDDRLRRALRTRRIRGRAAVAIHTLGYRSPGAAARRSR